VRVQVWAQRDGACFGHSSGAATAATITAATGRVHRGTRRFWARFSRGDWLFNRWRNDRDRLWFIQLFRRDTHHRGRCDQRLIGLFKGDDRLWLRFGFRIFNHNGGRLRDQRFTQAARTSSRAFSFRFTKPQKLMTGFPSTRNRKFSPGTERLFDSREPKAVARF
jgi:hypothetical protein